MNIKVKNYLEFVPTYIAIKLLSLLPYALIEKLLKNLCLWGGYYLGIRKDIAAKQLRMVFPEKSQNEINTILREMYLGIGQTMTEFYFASASYFSKIADVSGWEYVEECLSEGKGLIIACGHIGNWELGARFIAYKGKKIKAIVKKMRNDLFDDYTNSMRKKEGMEIIYTSKALKPILSALKNNEVVGFLIDQHARKEGEMMDFLGHKCSTHLGAAKISLRTGAPIIPAFPLRKPDGSYILTFEKPIKPGKNDSLDDIIELTRLLNHRLELQIINNPSQWFWLHKRWR